MPLKTMSFDAADYLYDEESWIEFLRLAFANGEPAEIVHSIRTVARAVARHDRPGETVTLTR